MSGLLLDGLRTRDDARQIGILTRSRRGGVYLCLAPLLALDFLVLLLFLASLFFESLVDRNDVAPFLRGAVRPAVVGVVMGFRQALDVPSVARMRGCGA